MSTREDIVKEVLGRFPSRRFNAKTVLGQLTEAYPAQMHVIADHLGARLDEAGEDCPAGKRLAILLESELLALRNVLFGQVINEGVVTSKGEHPHLKTILRISDQIKNMINLIGVERPEKSKPVVDVAGLWAKAIDPAGPSENEASNE